MKPYKIASAATISPLGVEIVVKGPGIGPAGLRRRFVSLFDADRFVDALNMAFEQGVKKRSEEGSGSSRAAGGDRS